MEEKNLKELVSERVLEEENTKEIAEKVSEEEISEEIAEEFISGFCKAQNQTRMVVCEIARQKDGAKKLVFADCAYGKCEHSSDCLLMGQIE